MVFPFQRKAKKLSERLPRKMFLIDEYDEKPHATKLLIL